MKLKLDENIGQRGLELLRRSGHDVMTVRDQNLQGTTDGRLWEVCAREERVLITLDRDFGQVLRFPPEESAGIVILEIGPRAPLQNILDRLTDFLCLAETQSVAGKLWIVEPGRVRIHLRE